MTLEDFPLRHSPYFKKIINEGHLEFSTHRSTKYVAMANVLEFILRSHFACVLFLSVRLRWNKDLLSPIVTQGWTAERNEEAQELVHTVTYYYLQGKFSTTAF